MTVFDSRVRTRSLGMLFFAAALLFTARLSLAEDAGKWEGVDKSVVEKIAAEHGREARKPLINTDQGDLLLFVFLIAGAAGGFAGGYCWRMLSEKEGPKAARGGVPLNE